MMMMPSLFNNDFDLFDDFYQDPWFDNRDFKKLEKNLYGHRAKNIMSTDVKETEDSYELEMDLPGFDKEDVAAKLSDGYLTISASKSLTKEDSDEKGTKKSGKYIRKERYAGSCQRSFYVGDALRQEDIKASFKHGILKLEIPKTPVKELEQDKYIAIEG